jgi:hypothetical protein
MPMIHDRNYVELAKKYFEHARAAADRSEVAAISSRFIGDKAGLLQVAVFKANLQDLLT